MLLVLCLCDDESLVIARENEHEPNTLKNSKPTHSRPPVQDNMVQKTGENVGVDRNSQFTTLGLQNYA